MQTFSDVRPRPDRPLSVIAGINSPGAVVLDAPAYPGNSGGPAIEVNPQTTGGIDYRIVGVMDSFIPYEETWRNEQFQITNVNVENSSYSAVIPIDEVLPLFADPYTPKQTFVPPPITVVPDLPGTRGK